MKIAFVTGNKGKITSAATHLAPLGITVEPIRLELQEIQATSVKTVALHKAQQAWQILHRPLIVEDSGFGLDELHGYPGPQMKLLLEAANGPSGVHSRVQLNCGDGCRVSPVAPELILVG